MLIRVHPPMAVLYTTRQTTVKESKELTAMAIRDLYQYVADLDLLICGPQYRFYYGTNESCPANAHRREADPDTPFNLEIALPVQGQIPTALLPFFKQTAPFRCLSSRYEGCWEGLPAEYDKMVQYISENELEANGIFAESLLHIDFAAPAHQITEIQIGLS